MLLVLGAGIAPEAAMSVLLMPRSLVCFADGAYADHLHGIDEVRHWQAASSTACIICGFSSVGRLLSLQMYKCMYKCVCAHIFARIGLPPSLGTFMVRLSVAVFLTSLILMSL